MPALTKYFLVRTPSTDEGTFGEIDVQGVRFYTAELPDRGNQREISSIPTGEYLVIPHKSPKFGDCYRLNNVPDRSDILIHVGNYAGDKLKGYLSDVQGCILIGEKLSTAHGQRIVANSRAAFAQFCQLIGLEPFILEIKNAI